MIKLLFCRSNISLVEERFKNPHIPEHEKCERELLILCEIFQPLQSQPVDSRGTGVSANLGVDMVERIGNGVMRGRTDRSRILANLDRQIDQCCQRSDSRNELTNISQLLDSQLRPLTAQSFD